MADTPKWAQEITLDDIPAQHRKLADVMGVEAMLQCADVMGGTYAYIPKKDALLRVIRDKRIREEFHSTDTRTLAAKYDLSQVQIYAILKGKVVMPGQGDFFGVLEAGG